VDHSDRVDQFEITLGSLELGPASDVAGARALSALEAGEAVFVLESLIARERSSARASRALAVVSRALAFASEADLPEEQRARIRHVAANAGVHQVGALLERSAQGAPKATVEQDAPPGVLTLGHKKMLARIADQDRIVRLAMEGDPRVVRELLLNPRLTEAMVVRIVARRPARVEAVYEVWRSPRWSSRINVRRALALNPSTPIEISLKLLPHMMVPDLKEIANDHAMAPDVRAMAAVLLQVRKRK
jgi:hypothetical protein